MNKLIFTLKRNWNKDIILVANNHKDLENHLRSNYDFFKITVRDDSVSIVEREGYETEVATLEWSLHI